MVHPIWYGDTYHLACLQKTDGISSTNIHREEERQTASCWTVVEFNTLKMTGEEAFKELLISYFPKVKDLQTTKGVDLEPLSIMPYYSPEVLKQ